MSLMQKPVFSCLSMVAGDKGSFCSTDWSVQRIKCTGCFCDFAFVGIDKQTLVDTASRLQPVGRMELSKLRTRQKWLSITLARAGKHWQHYACIALDNCGQSSAAVVTATPSKRPMMNGSRRAVRR